MLKKPINRLVVIGIGLIGGSLAAGLKKANACNEVIGIARRRQTCKDAIRLGVVDRAFLSLEDVADELGAGDVVFIAVPTLTVKTVLADCAKLLSSEVTITDGASAVIITKSENAKKYTDQPVYILGAGQSSEPSIGVSNMSSITEWHALKRAAKKAYDMIAVPLLSVAILMVVRRLTSNPAKAKSRQTLKCMDCTILSS